MLTSLMSKVPASYNQDAMVTVCALREDVTSSQQLVTETSDPFLVPLGGEDNPQQHTSPEQTEDDESIGEELNQLTNYRMFSNLIRTLFTVSEGQKIRCGLDSRS